MKTVIISGGCGLLGEEFAKTLYNEGYCVVVLDLPGKVKEYGLDNYFEIGCDITDEKQVINIIKQIYFVHGVDCLINCAAINPVPKEGDDNSFEYYSLKKWEETLKVNLTGAFLLSRECSKFMMKNESIKGGFKGNIINIASDLGVIAPYQDIYTNDYIKPPDYGVSKAGLINLTKYIASYYGCFIKSVCLCPGSIYNGQSNSLKKNLEFRIPIGRLAKKDEYNGIIKFLCSSDSDYMQGHCIEMNGGRTSW